MGADTKQELPPMPIWLQNIIKAIYLTGISLILFCVLVFIAFFLNYPLQDFSYNVGLYLEASTIINFLFLNQNIKIEKVGW